MHTLELGPPTPSSESECVFPFRPKGRGEHSLAVEGIGGPNSEDWTEAWHSVSVGVTVLLPG
jgi:hypothetical protein